MIFQSAFVFALDLAEDLNDDDLINALEGDIQLFGDDDDVDIGWTKFDDDEEELKEVEEAPVEEASEPEELKAEEEESDDEYEYEDDDEQLFPSL